MKAINHIMQVKEGKSYTTTMTQTDEKEVYKSLAHDLIAKKINQCSYIRSIRRVNNFNGTVTVTVMYDNDTRSIYTVEE